MSERIFHVEPPLTAEQREPFDYTTRIEIVHSYRRRVIRREWVRDHAGEGASYGYADKPDVESNSDGKLDLSVPGVLDVAALTLAILAELQRQRTEKGRS